MQRNDQNQSDLCKQPNEIINKGIGFFLNQRDLTALKLTCKKLKDVVNQETIKYAQDEGPRNYACRLPEKNVSLSNAHSTPITALVAMKNNYFASASQDQEIKIWDDKNVYVKSFKGHTSHVSALLYLSETDQLVSASWDGTIIAWNQTGTSMLTLPSDGSIVDNIARLSEDRLVCTSRKHVTIWDMKTGQVEKTLANVDGICRLAILKDKTIVVGDSDGLISYYHPDTGNCINHIDLKIGAIVNLAMLENGNLIVTGVNDNSHIHILKDGALTKTLQAQKCGVMYAFPLPGNALISYTWKNLVSTTYIGSERFQSPTGHKGLVYAMAVRSDGSIITGGEDKMIHITHFTHKNRQTAKPGNNCKLI